MFFNVQSAAVLVAVAALVYSQRKSRSRKEDSKLYEIKIILNEFKDDIQFNDNETLQTDNKSLQFNNNKNLEFYASEQGAALHNSSLY
jgi:hypothetical protein